MLPVRPWGLFYFMTEIKFFCETTSNELQVLQFDDFIEISIDTNSIGFNIPAVHLTIKDAELLMDELHSAIIKVEKYQKEKGGKND